MDNVMDTMDTGRPETRFRAFAVITKNASNYYPYDFDSNTFITFMLYRRNQTEDLTL